MNHPDTVDPVKTNDSSQGYNQFDLWINTTTGKCFLCRQNMLGAALWVPLTPPFSVKAFGAYGNGVNDDTKAVQNAITAACLQALGSGSYPGSVYFPAGVYLISEQAGTGNKNTQNITFAAQDTTGTFQLNLILLSKTAAPTPRTTPQINYDHSNTATTAFNIAAGLNMTSAGNIGAQCPDPGPGSTTYQVTFPEIQGAIPPMTATINTGLTSVSIAILTAGAALATPGNLVGLRIFGDGPRQAPWSGLQPPANYPPAGSVLVWQGNIDGIMLEIRDAVNPQIENLSVVGANTSTVPSPGVFPQIARNGILFSSTGGAGANYEVSNCTFTQFTSQASPQLPNAGVQFGITGNDFLCAQSCFINSVFANIGVGGNGILLRNNQSVTHRLFGCDFGGLTNAIWAQAGGNLSVYGSHFGAVGTVLRLGTSLGYPYQGGGPNASTFLLHNIRTESNASAGPNVTLVDAGYLSGFASIEINGWDDVKTIATDPTPAIILGQGADVILRNSLVQRTAITSLAMESGSVLSVTATQQGSGYNPAAGVPKLRGDGIMRPPGSWMPVKEL